ncbi:hypothetical protein ACE2AJ_00355 [Aquihabitans daechungensis]|uniref:hypothetical protein n=1 Tax=Aquihabitans daechungensis TaxID=1052257 RepID=UPI003B9DDD8C
MWWFGNDNPVNFNGFDDADINRLLDDDRSETDPAKRAEIYQQINGAYSKQLWNVWLWFTPWAVAEKSNVHGPWVRRCPAPTRASRERQRSMTPNGHRATGWPAATP